MSARSAPRIPPATARELGIINWAFCRLAALVMRVPDVHLFSTLGRARGLFRGWLHFSATLMPFGRLSRYETELVILRVAHLRGCDYELDHHRRLAARVGMSPAAIERVFAGPEAEGLPPNHRALLVAADQLVLTRGIDDRAWDALASHYTRRELVEIVMLVNQYDALATTIGVLGVARDFR